MYIVLPQPSRGRSMKANEGHRWLDGVVISDHQHNLLRKSSRHVSGLSCTHIAWPFTQYPKQEGHVLQSERHLPPRGNETVCFRAPPVQQCANEPVVEPEPCVAVLQTKCAPHPVPLDQSCQRKKSCCITYLRTNARVAAFSGMQCPGARARTLPSVIPQIATRYGQWSLSIVLSKSAGNTYLVQEAAAMPYL